LKETDMTKIIFAITGAALILATPALAAERHSTTGPTIPHVYSGGFDQGTDLPRAAYLERRARLAQLVRRVSAGLMLNPPFEGDGATVFERACSLGCEGIVSKRAAAPYASGRSSAWIKTKNPASPAVRREAVEDWSR
jgi:ATP-dependent DNA ligase